MTSRPDEGEQASSRRRWWLGVAAAALVLVIAIAVALGRPTAAVVFELGRALDRLPVPDGWSGLGDVSEVLARDVLADEVLMRRAWAAEGSVDRVCDELAAMLDAWPSANAALQPEPPGAGEDCRGGGVVTHRGLWVRGEVGMLAAVDAETDTAFADRDDRGPLPDGYVLVTIQLREVRPSWLQ